MIWQGVLSSTVENHLHGNQMHTMWQISGMNQLWTIWQISGMNQMYTSESLSFPCLGLSSQYLFVSLAFWGFSEILQQFASCLFRGLSSQDDACFNLQGDTCLSIDLARTSVRQFFHSQLVSDCLKWLISVLPKLQRVLVVIFLLWKLDSGYGSTYNINIHMNNMESSG